MDGGCWTLVAAGTAGSMLKPGAAVDIRACPLPANKPLMREVYSHAVSLIDGMGIAWRTVDIVTNIAVATGSAPSGGIGPRVVQDNAGYSEGGKMSVISVML